MRLWLLPLHCQEWGQMAQCPLALPPNSMATRPWAGSTLPPGVRSPRAIILIVLEGPGSRESQQWTVEGKWPGRSGSGSSCCQTSNFLSTPSAYIHLERLPPPGTPHTDCRTQAEDAGPAIQTDPTGLPSYRALQVKGSSHSSGLMGDKSLSHSTALDQKVKALQPWK